MTLTDSITNNIDGAETSNDDYIDGSTNVKNRLFQFISKTT